MLDRSAGIHAGPRAWPECHSRGTRHAVRAGFYERAIFDSDGARLLAVPAQRFRLVVVTVRPATETCPQATLIVFVTVVPPVLPPGR